MSALNKLQLIAPDYAALSNAQDYIDLADDQVSAAHCQRELAVAYLAAHTIAMSDRGATGGSGSVTSQSEGSLTIAYGNSMSGNEIASTAYGQEYLRLSKQCGNLGGFLMRTF